MPEYRFTFTISEHGRLPENGERFMEAFMKVFPEGGPSISQNTTDGTLSVTFIVDASGGREAINRAVDIFCEGAIASGLEATDILDFEGAVVPADEFEDAEVLQPA